MTVLEKQNEMKQKLLDVALVLGDAAPFCNLWFFMNKLIEQAEDGDVQAKDIIRVAEQFIRLVKVSQGEKL
jgi:hypothetical protein